MNEEHLNKIYSWARDIFQKFLPEDLPLFRISWPAYLSVLKKIDLKALTFGAFEGEVSHQEGFAYPGKSGVFSPIIYALSASFESLSSLPEKMNFEVIQGIVRDNLAYWEVPDENKTAIIDHISHLLEIEFSAPSEAGVVGRKEFRVFEGGEEKLCTDEEVNGYRSKKDRFDIFLDDVSGEVLLGRKNKICTFRAGETDIYLTLRCLLERTGGYWTHEELFEKGTVEDINAQEHYESRISQRVYQRVRYIKEKLEEGIDRKKVDAWLDTKGHKRIMVGRNLKTCLIRRMI